MAKATVTSKGQVTIPLAIREKLALHPGTVLEFDESSEHLEATKAIDTKRMYTVIGIAADSLGDKTTEQWIEELRGAVDLPNHRGNR